MKKEFEGIWSFKRNTKGAFLSNYYDYPIEYKGHTFSTSEALYQSMKLEGFDEHPRFHEFTDIKSSDEVFRAGQIARDLGQIIPIRSDWTPQARVDAMLETLRCKFSYPEMKEKLLATKDWYLRETAHWYEPFFGFFFWDKYTYKHRPGPDGGENLLGLLLMVVRAEIRATEDPARYMKPEVRKKYLESLAEGNDEK